MKHVLTLVLASLSLLATAQNALNFDGVNDKVQTTYPGVLGSADRTFEAWVNVDPSAPAANLNIVDYGTNVAGSRNSFSVAADRGLVYISGGTSANISSIPGVVPAGTWTHVAFVLHSGVGFLYVNGTQVGTGDLSNVNTPSGFENLSIGQRVSGGSIPFEGSIDEVRIWNVARDSLQLQSLKDTEICSPPSSLVAYYQINEGTAGGVNTGITTTADEVAGNDGTLTSFALTGATSNFVTGAALGTSSTSMQTFDECVGFSVTVGSNTYSTTGVYVDTLTGATGCDSIVTTDLTINSPAMFTQTFNECEGFSVNVGSNTYSATGVYTDTLVAVAGCDSIVTTDLTISSVDVSTSVSGSIITAQLGGASYTWLNCDSNNAVIAGATSQSFTPSQSGNYAVVVDDGSCSDTSDCVSVMLVGLEGFAEAGILLYPNPVKDYAVIQWETLNSFSVTIVNSTGQRWPIGEGIRQIDLSRFPAGTYFIEIVQEDAIYRRKFVKL